MAGQVRCLVGHHYSITHGMGLRQNGESFGGNPEYHWISGYLLSILHVYCYHEHENWRDDLEEEDMIEPLKVGDRVLFVPNDRRYREPTWLDVVKVGRKWVYLSQRDFRLATDDMIVDGGQYSSPGRCYRSEEEYAAQLLRRAQWQQIREFVDRRYGTPPDGCDLEAVAKALGFTLKAEEPVT